MAIFHLSVQIISRVNDRSAVFAAAYRAGERLNDERLGKVADYTKKRRPLHTEILAPPNAPSWVFDRESLWNQVERAEKRKDSQLAREITVALPIELSVEQQIELVRGYVREQFVQQGMVADFAVNQPKRSNSSNFYAHIMLTTRSVGPDGFGQKERSWNQPEFLNAWREKWAKHINQALAEAGSEERVDHRSLSAQGSPKEPSLHLGPRVLSEQESKNKERAKEQQRIAVVNRERLERLAFRKTPFVAFKRSVAAAYNDKCAVTDSDIALLLEATHIVPLGAGGQQSVQNGLLLRTDIHKLFATNQLTIHPETLQVCIAPDLRNTEPYRGLQGKRLRLPENKALHPKAEFLARHYQQCRWAVDSDDGASPELVEDIWW